MIDDLTTTLDYVNNGTTTLMIDDLTTTLDYVNNGTTTTTRWLMI
jgi:hypothetical protein